MENLFDNPFMKNIADKHIRIRIKLDKRAIILSRCLYALVKKVSIGIK